MDLAVKTHHFHVTQELQRVIDRKAERLGRLLDRVTDATLELRREQPRTGGTRYIAQLTIATNYALLRAEESAADAHAAVDAVAAKMERQVARYRSKWKSRKTGHHAEMAALPALAEEPVADSETEPEAAMIVRTKTFGGKPLAPDEAIEQMELLGHAFFAFVSAADGAVNVVYRRRNGGYGLLQPAEPQRRE